MKRHLPSPLLDPRFFVLCLALLLSLPVSCERAYA